MAHNDAGLCGRIHIDIVGADAITDNDLAPLKAAHQLGGDFQTAAENPLGLLANPQSFFQWEISRINEFAAGGLNNFMFPSSSGVTVLEQNSFEFGHGSARGQTSSLYGRFAGDGVDD